MRKEEDPSILQYKGLPNRQITDRCLSSLTGCQVYVFANQGKSIRTHLWSLDQLLQSNHQLSEFDPDLEMDKEKYVLKADGIAELCSRIVVLKPV